MEDLTEIGAFGPRSFRVKLYKLPVNNKNTVEPIYICAHETVINKISLIEWRL